jgi:secreted Zn-dependent insulinase-like peptidase
MTQSDAIRDALQKLGVEADTAGVKEYIRQNHKGVSVTAPGFPSALSSLKRELKEAGGATAAAATAADGAVARKKKKKVGRPAKAASAAGPLQSVGSEGHLVSKLQQLRSILGRENAKRAVSEILDRA